MVDTHAVDCVLERAIDAGEVPGVVALAADDGGIIYSGAFGVREIGTAFDMSVETVFWIASMTKAVTSVAAMQLVEQERVGLDEPLAARIPGLATVQVLDGFDETGAPRLRPPRRPLTLRHLLTHTAGFAYDMWNADMLRYGIEIKNRNPTFGESATDFLTAPLVFDPGDRWEYGISIDWVGQTVEHLSGQTLEDYFREHIFDPLGMTDSGFAIRPDQMSRLASVHARQADGALEVFAYGPAQPPTFYEGGGGLYSTGPDYLQFQRMLLGGGECDGVRVLRSETVAEMGTNQIGELTAGVLKTSIPFKSNDVEFFPGMVKTWGLGYLITTQDAPTGRAAGSLSWAGLANTYYWIDPVRKLTGLLMTQIMPFGDTAVLDLFARFESTIYASRA